MKGGSELSFKFRSDLIIREELRRLVNILVKMQENLLLLLLQKVKWRSNSSLDFIDGFPSHPQPSISSFRNLQCPPSKMTCKTLISLEIADRKTKWKRYHCKPCWMRSFFASCCILRRLDIEFSFRCDDKKRCAFLLCRAMKSQTLKLLSLIMW